MLSFVCSSLCTDQLWPHCMHNIDHRYSALLQTKWHGLCVCVCVCHDCEPCKNGRTDQEAIWGQTHVGQRNHVLCIRWECTLALRGEYDGSLFAAVKQSLAA